MANLSIFHYVSAPWIVFRGFSGGGWKERNRVEQPTLLRQML
jgi:hypothetical protein